MCAIQLQKNFNKHIQIKKTLIIIPYLLSSLYDIIILPVIAVTVLLDA